MFPTIIASIDIVLLTLNQGQLCVTLAPRDKAPFEGINALPGGYIHAQEDSNCLAAAVRILREKTGITPPYLEQLQTFAGASRDPRGWSISIAYFALVPAEVIAVADHPGVSLCLVDKLGFLPFDHNDMIASAVDRIRNKSQYSSLPCHLAGETFTLPKLQKIYEACLGETLNKVSFRRKMDEMDVLEAIHGQTETGGAHRPAQIYRLKPEFKDCLQLLARGL